MSTRANISSNLPSAQGISMGSREYELLMERLITIEKKQDLILAQQEQLLNSKPQEAELDISNKALWGDSVRIQNLLGISERTVSRYTKSGLFKPIPVGTRNYYYLPDILPHRNKFLK